MGVLARPPAVDNFMPAHLTENASRIAAAAAEAERLRRVAEADAATVAEQLARDTALVLVQRQAALGTDGGGDVAAASAAALTEGLVVSGDGVEKAATAVRDSVAIGWDFSAVSAATTSSSAEVLHPYHVLKLHLDMLPNRLARPLTREKALAPRREAKVLKKMVKGPVRGPEPNPNKGKKLIHKLCVTEDVIGHFKAARRQSLLRTQNGEFKMREAEALSEAVKNLGKPNASQAAKMVAGPGPGLGRTLGKLGLGRMKAAAAAVRAGWVGSDDDDDEEEEEETGGHA